MRQQIELSQPQFDLVATDAPFPAFVGGFGSGKTAGLIERALMLKCRYPTGNIGYYLPTFDLVDMIAMPRFEEKLEERGIPYKSVKSPRPKIQIEGAGEIIMRTMDKPGRIIGYEVMDSLVDEIDTLKTDNARECWRKIMSRNRQKKPDGKPNTIAVGTTPEGFKFVYEEWGKEQKPGHELIRASTYSNAHNLPENYISDLLDNYPTALIQAYIEGLFVNLTSGSVYPEFDRVLNGSNEVIGTFRTDDGIELAEDLHIGMDFNVTKMAAIVHVPRYGFPHAVDELMNIFDTPAMIKAIKNKYPNNRIFIYPDASGGSRATNNASESDISLLRQANFNVMAREANPPVKDRVLALNVLIKNAKGKRNYFVNPKKCPKFTEALEVQAYNDRGEPDKSSGHDHPLDAAGYFAHYNFPVRGKPVSRIRTVGM
jgi:hypothetical protein